jgi:hypothetical protein
VNLDARTARETLSTQIRYVDLNVFGEARRCDEQ